MRNTDQYLGQDLLYEVELEILRGMGDGERGVYKTLRGALEEAIRQTNLLFTGTKSERLKYRVNVNRWIWRSSDGCYCYDGPEAVLYDPQNNLTHRRAGEDGDIDPLNLENILCDS